MTEQNMEKKILKYIFFVFIKVELRGLAFFLIVSPARIHVQISSEEHVYIIHRIIGL